LTPCGQQVKNIIFVFLVLTLVSSLSAVAFVTGNLAFAKKSSGGGNDGGGGGSSDKGGSSKDNGGDKGGGGGNDNSGGGSSDKGGGGSSDNGGGGSTDNTGGGGSDNTNAGSGDTSGSTTSPPPVEENTPPPAENQQQTVTCPDGSTADSMDNCPESTSTKNTTPAPVDCTANPTDPSCTNTAANTPAPVDCTANPTDPSCTNTAANTPAPVDCTANPTDPSCTKASLASPTTTPVTCGQGTHLDSFNGKCMPNSVDPYTDDGDFKCIEDYHLTVGGRCQSNIFAASSSGCVTGWHRADDISIGQCTRDTTPSTEPSYAYVDVGKARPPDGFTNPCDKGTNIGDRCVIGAIDIGGVQPSGTCSAGNKIGNRCMVMPPQVIDMPKALGHCPEGYRVLTAGVSCAFDIKMQASTPATTQTGNNGGGGGASTTPTNTGSATPSTTPMKTGTETTTTTPANTGNPNTTPTTTTTTTTNPSTSTSTTTTNVINRGGSSSGGGGAASGGSSSGGGTASGGSSSGGGTASGGSSSGGGTSAAAPGQGANAFLTYVNAVNKISIKYPSTWTKTEFTGNPKIPVMFNAPITTAATSTTAAGAKTNFVISTTPGAADLDSFVQQQINALTQSNTVKYTITDSNAKVLTPPTGITAFREVSYDGMKSGNGVQVPLRGAAIFFVSGGTGYSLLYLAKQTEYTQNLPMVQQMVNSFQVGSSGGPVQNVAAASSR
jgi:hypothetical protein